MLLKECLTSDQIANQVREIAKNKIGRTKEIICGWVKEQVDESTRDQVRVGVERQVRNQIMNQVRDQIIDITVKGEK